MRLTRFTLAVLFALLLAAIWGCQPAGQRNAMPESTQELASERASWQAVAISTLV